MNKGFSCASASFLALALAACGSPEEEEVDGPVAVEVEPGQTIAEAEAEGLAPGEVAGEVDPAETGLDAEPTVSASPTPTPTPSATRTPAPTPTPSQVASATPPAAFTTCRVCHSVEPGENRIGPSLAGVFGRRAGSVPGANYSPAMRAANITWNQGTLDRYLADPQAVVPGTTMPDPGLEAAQRRAVIDYLRTL